MHGHQIFNSRGAEVTSSTDPDLLEDLLLPDSTRSIGTFLLSRLRQNIGNQGAFGLRGW